MAQDEKTGNNNNAFRSGELNSDFRKKKVKAKRNKELKRLTKLELLELLHEQSKEMDSLRAELKKTKAELADKRINIRESGDIAEAALKLSGVFEAAQDAADLYLSNIKRRSGGRYEK